LTTKSLFGVFFTIGTTVTNLPVNYQLAGFARQRKKLKAIYLLIAASSSFSLVVLELVCQIKKLCTLQAHFLHIALALKSACS